MDNTEKRLYDLKQASQYLGIPRKTLRQMIANGEIKFIRRPSRTRDRRLYYLDKNDIDDWIDKNKQQHYF